MRPKCQPQIFGDPRKHPGDGLPGKWDLADRSRFDPDVGELPHRNDERSDLGVRNVFSGEVEAVGCHGWAEGFDLRDAACGALSVKSSEAV